MCTEATEWRTVFGNQICNKGPVSRIQKESSKLTKIENVQPSFLIGKIPQCIFQHSCHMDDINKHIKIH